MSDTYFSDIESAFVRARGKHLFLQTTDFALVQTWQERSIPVHVVLSSINTVFKNYNENENGKPKRLINSLSYCTQEVEAQFASWSESQVGKSETYVSSDAEEEAFNDITVRQLTERMKKLEAIQETAPDKLREAIELVVPLLFSAIKEFEIHQDLQRLEEELSHLESQLNDAIGASVSGKEYAELTKTLEKELGGLSRNLNNEVYMQTLNSLRLKTLRELYNVPRLSLFYL